MNDRVLNNNRTFIFKTSLTASEIASQLNRESNHFLSSCYIFRYQRKAHKEHDSFHVTCLASVVAETNPISDNGL